MRPEAGKKGRDSLLAITEQEILNEIKEIAVEQNLARTKVAFHKKAAVDAESDLIAANLSMERAREKLRVFHMTHPKKEITPRDREIESFKEKLPELLKRLEPSQTSFSFDDEKDSDQ